MSDERINQTMLLILSEIPDVRVWRQNVAKLPDRTGRWIQFGIPGMADISGVAGPQGWRLEIEMKPETGRHRTKKTVESQRKWQRMIGRMGGIYIEATGERDAVEKLRARLEERRLLVRSLSQD